MSDDEIRRLRVALEAILRECNLPPDYILKIETIRKIAEDALREPAAVLQFRRE